MDIKDVTAEDITLQLAQVHELEAGEVGIYLQAASRLADLATAPALPAVGIASTANLQYRGRRPGRSFGADCERLAAGA